MTTELLQHDYFLRQELETDPVDIWLDWVPAIDGVPDTPTRAWRVGNDLHLETLDGQSRPERALSGLDEQVWQSLLTTGGRVILCGPSGILARRVFSLT